MEQNLYNSTSLRYIVFLIDSKIKDHSGKVFCSYKDAKEYTADVIFEKYAEKAIVGMFAMESNAKEMLITFIETIGFPGDKNNINQLELFKPYLS